MEQLEMKFVVALKTGEEQGYVNDKVSLDLDLGDTNDFELQMKQDDWSKDKYWYGSRIFILGTEYGGIMNDLEVITRTREIVWRGPTWRGLLTQKVVEPPEGEDHLTVSGDLNDILRELIGDRFEGLFLVPDSITGVSVSGWQVDRYVTLYDAITKLLDSKGYRLQIIYVEPEDLEYGYVTLQAVPVTDYSDELEYSREGKLEEDGIKRLKSLQNRKSIDVKVNEISAEIGDIVGGYEELTETRLQKPITGKVIEVKNGKLTVEYKIEGDE